ncbi:unnamed protein product [Leptidea sinapis]|uniref:Uncharacterized protein n=1 Tax=Leptidea sinapis TaxID=189913 RepID=A0A5E4PUU0_9NEOP|nr:unnamed protein product [Leptidea sinapis]
MDEKTWSGFDSGRLVGLPEILQNMADQDQGNRRSTAPPFSLLQSIMSPEFLINLITELKAHIKTTESTELYQQDIDLELEKVRAVPRRFECLTSRVMVHPHPTHNLDLH